jgi:hypothetical protein
MSQRTFWSAADLLAAEFEPPRWAVPDLLAEGLNILGAPPKSGKSYFALHCAVAVPAGGLALGSIQVERGEVVYFALEDPARRLQERLRAALQGSPAPAGLDFATALPRLDKGGVEEIDGWLSNHANPRLVIVDVFARVRRADKSAGNAYQQDYEAVQPLKDVADKHCVAILVIHHTRKQDDPDFMATVSGSYGVTGPADAVLVMKRKRSQAVTELHVTSRDYGERSLALRFDGEYGSFQLLGDEHVMSDLRRRIVELLRKEARPLGPTAVAGMLGEKPNTVKPMMTKMRDDDQIVANGDGMYRLPDAQPQVHAA